MKKVFFCLCLMLMFLLFCSCSPTPGSWLNTEEINSVSVDGVKLVVDISGYPPFSCEIYDNLFFEGNPIGTAIVDSEGVTTLYATSFSSPYSVGSPLYMRVQSKYGHVWAIYGSDPENPEMLLPYYNILGSPTNPYVIGTRQDLIDLMNQNSIRYASTAPWAASYVLTDNIDLTGVTWIPIGIDAVSPFTGTFNGNGYFISGVDQFSGTSTRPGFFGYTSSPAVIKNLGLKLGDINDSSGADTMGGLVSLVNPGTTIANCYVTGTRITSSSRLVGGLIGAKLGDSKIINCYTDITMQKGANPAQWCGGFVGDMLQTGGDIENCYSAGDVIDDGTIGTTLSRCYLGGFLGTGEDDATGTFTSCIALNNRIVNLTPLGEFAYFGASYGLSDSTTYYNQNMENPGGSALYFVYGPTSSISVNPNTMNQNSAPFNAWDFVNTWKWDNATNRPILRTVRQ